MRSACSGYLSVYSAQGGALAAPVALGELLGQLGERIGLGIRVIHGDSSSGPSPSLPG